MLGFVRKHWKAISLTTGAITIGALCLFNPPGLVIGAVFALASSPLFTAFGSYAAAVATGVVFVGAAITAAIASLTVMTILNAFANLVGWAASKCGCGQDDSSSDDLYRRTEERGFNSDNEAMRRLHAREGRRPPTEYPAADAAARGAQQRNPAGLGTGRDGLYAHSQSQYGQPQYGQPPMHGQTPGQFPQYGQPPMHEQQEYQGPRR